MAASMSRPPGWRSPPAPTCWSPALRHSRAAPANTPPILQPCAAEGAADDGRHRNFSQALEPEDAARKPPAEAAGAAIPDSVRPSLAPADPARDAPPAAAALPQPAIRLDARQALERRSGRRADRNVARRSATRPGVPRGRVPLRLRRREESEAARQSARRQRSVAARDSKLHLAGFLARARRDAGATVRATRRPRLVHRHGKV